MTTYLAISVGAVLGANARYLVGGWIAERLGSAFPYGTLLINVTGSFLLTAAMTLLLARSLGPPWVRPLVAIGFCGSYTTFSTFSYETLGLAQSGSYLAAAGNIIMSVAAALAGAYLGTVVARSL